VIGNARCSPIFPQKMTNPIFLRLAPIFLLFTRWHHLSHCAHSHTIINHANGLKHHPASSRSRSGSTSVCTSGHIGPTAISTVPQCRIT